MLPILDAARCLPPRPRHVVPAIPPTARLSIADCSTSLHPAHDAMCPTTDALNGHMLGVLLNRMISNRDGYNAEYQRYDHANDGSDSHT